ncbi:MAG: phosphatase PAP2 family protein [Pseudomonadales bacterium]|nr:phosphatase PAP2 family protein [Pseudomonadales bacterium]
MLLTIHEWDVHTFRRIVSSRIHGTLVATARAISHTADGWAYPLLPALAWLFGYAEAGTFLTVVATSFAVERLVYLFAKKGFKRRRPANVVPGYRSHIIASDEFSFFSGHTSAAFLMVTLLVIFYGPMFGVLYLWSAAVGASRIILGVHFPSDVLVGSMMGTLAAFTLCAWFGIT